jgi:hypothetical protein
MKRTQKTTNLDTSTVGGQNVLLGQNLVLVTSELGETPVARNDNQLTARELRLVRNLFKIIIK